jgi:hypothetical protein
MVYDTIRLELIEKYEVSCQRCCCLYFKPKGDELIVEQYSTYLKSDNKRYCIVGLQEYSVSHVLSNFRHLLELSIIEMDHLTMEEQLERKLIKSSDEYCPKKNMVSALKSEDAMRLEARKCQHLCMKCHLIITIEREIGLYPGLTKGRISEQEKAAYVYKIKATGCVSCGLKDETLPRFFDMDHLGNKVDGISEMIKNPDVTLEDVIDETKKCRVLCKHCHRIHTMKQKVTGILSLKIKSE